MSYRILQSVPLARLRDDRARERCIEYQLTASALIQREFLLANPRTPSIFNAGVRYIDDTGAPLDEWRSIPEIIAHRGGDCDDLVPWRMAELMIAGVTPQAMARIQQARDGRVVFHALLRYGPNTEDICRRLGMQI